MKFTVSETVQTKCYINVLDRYGRDTDRLEGSVYIAHSFMNPEGGYTAPMTPMHQTEPFATFEEAVEYCKHHSSKVCDWTGMHYATHYSSHFDLVPIDFTNPEWY